MSKFRCLTALYVLLAGCSGAGQIAQTSRVAAVATNEPEIYGADQLAEIPAGRFCRINSSRPGTAYEGTVVRSTAEAIVLTETVALIPKSPAMKVLPRLSHLLNPSAHVEIPDGEISIDRDQINFVEVYDEPDSRGLAAQQADWRKSQKRIREQLATTPEFPSSG